MDDCRACKSRKFATCGRYLVKANTNSDTNNANNGHSRHGFPLAMPVSIDRWNRFLYQLILRNAKTRMECMKSGVRLNLLQSLKFAATTLPWLLLIPLLGCRSQWPCDSSSNPYGYTAGDGAALDPYAQPNLAPPRPLNLPPASTQPALPQYAPAGQPIQSNQPFQPQGGVSPQFAPSTQPAQPFQPPIGQPADFGSGSLNPFSSGRAAPANPYGSINPSGGGFNTNTTIP